MPDIQMPDGQVVRFPDNMPRDQINSLISQRYPKEFAAAQKQVQSKLPTLQIEGLPPVTVDDSFGKLSPDQQQLIANEIAARYHAGETEGTTGQPLGPAVDGWIDLPPINANSANNGWIDLPTPGVGQTRQPLPQVPGGADPSFAAQPVANPSIGPTQLTAQSPAGRIAQAGGQAVVAGLAPDQPLGTLTALGGAYDDPQKNAALSQVISMVPIAGQALQAFDILTRLPPAAIQGIGNVVGQSLIEGGMKEDDASSLVGDLLVMLQVAGLREPALGSELMPAGSRILANQAKTADRDALIRAGQAEGVPIPKVIATDNAALQSVGRQTVDLPIIGAPLANSIEGMTENVKTAVDKLGSKYGSGSSYLAGSDLKSQVQNWISEGSQERPNRIYGHTLPSAIDTEASFPLTETQKVVSDLKAKRQASARNPESGAVSLVDEAINREAGLTYDGLKDLRASIGERLRGATNADSTLERAEMKQIYSALTDDMRNTVGLAGAKKALDTFRSQHGLTNEQEAGRVAAAGRDNALKILDEAETAVKAHQERKNTLLKITNAQSDEGAFNALARAAKEKGSSNIKLLAVARKTVGEGTWDEFVSALIHQIGLRPSEPGNWSLAEFTKNFTQMSPEAQKIVFKSKGSNDRWNSINNMAIIGRKKAVVESFSNPSRSGSYLTVFGIIAAAMAHPGFAAGGAIGGNLFSRLMSRPATARALSSLNMEYMRAVQKGRITKPLATAARAFALSTANQFGQRDQAQPLYQELSRQIASQFRNEPRN